MVSLKDGNHEIDKLLSFELPSMADIGATSSSTCAFLIKRAAVSNGSQTVEFYSLQVSLFENDPSVQLPSTYVQYVQSSFK
jgi:hypothetical protein